MVGCTFWNTIHNCPWNFLPCFFYIPLLEFSMCIAGRKKGVQRKINLLLAKARIWTSLWWFIGGITIESLDEKYCWLWRGRRGGERPGEPYRKNREFKHLQGPGTGDQMWLRMSVPGPPLRCRGMTTDGMFPNQLLKLRWDPKEKWVPDWLNLKNEEVFLAIWVCELIFRAASNSNDNFYCHRLNVWIVPKFLCWTLIPNMMIFGGGALGR